MNILVACEESQAVTKELRALGHRAFSCDLFECSGGRPEWHIQGDCLPLLDGFCEFTLQNGETDYQLDRCDMIIAFPPCTHLAVSGAAWFERKRANGDQRSGIEFFSKFLEVDCDRVAIENPIGIMSGDYVKKWFPDLAEKHNLPIKPTQIIQPWQFGALAEKSTCLWLKGLPPLIPDITEKPELEYWVSPSGKRMQKWFYETRCLPYKDRGKVSSKTFPGVAKAMATQWTNSFESDLRKSGNG